MSLSSFKLLTDENIDRSISEYLRAKGLDVFTVKGSHLEGRPDIEILHFAMTESRVVLTHDTDFTTIIHTNRIDFIGIIFLQPGHILATFTIQTIDILLAQDIDFRVPFIIVAENRNGTIKMRVRNNVEIK
jgi:predicted nuclease of predicted toxin-antitoxin system